MKSTSLIITRNGMMEQILEAGGIKKEINHGRNW